MKRIFVCLLVCCLPLLTYADQTAYTVRSTELRQKPYSDAASIATLAEKTSVSVLQRQGGWNKISSSQGEGWVKMLDLRASDAATKKGDTGLGSLFNIGRSGSSGTTVATGVRGLSEEDLKNAQPNPAELAKLQNFAANKAQAEKFARSGKLKTQTLDFVPAPQ